MSEEGLPNEMVPNLTFCSHPDESEQPSPSQVRDQISPA